MRYKDVYKRQVLQEAQSKGYAEADPSADVDGYDAAYKILILASAAFNKRVSLKDVYRAVSYTHLK